MQTTELGLSFDDGSLGIVDVKQHVAEVWVYVPAGVKWLRISHPKLGSVRYNFPTAIRKGRTYTMTLTTDKVFTATFDYNHSQKLILHVYPPTATVSVNGKLRTHHPLSFRIHRRLRSRIARSSKGSHQQPCDSRSGARQASAHGSSGERG